MTMRPAPRWASRGWARAIALHGTLTDGEQPDCGDAKLECSSSTTRNAGAEVETTPRKRGLPAQKSAAGDARKVTQEREYSRRRDC
jgi:hypothetical protein